MPDTTFVADVRAGLAAAKEAAGDGYVNVLGADVARQCFELGEVEEVLAIVAPVLRGDGTLFFHEPGGRELSLEAVRVETLPHAVNLWFRPVSARP